MKTKIRKNLATIVLGGITVKTEYIYSLPIFDPIYGPAVVFVKEESEEEIVIFRVHAENNRFVTEELITPSELQALVEESEQYKEELLEEIEELSDLEETFTGGLEKPLPEQIEEPDIMFR